MKEQIKRGNYLEMVPIISIVGCSNSGKTTLLEQLIPELKKSGLRVGTIKHDAHSFDIDHPGKDTWRHRQAGANSVMISSAKQFALISDTEDEFSLDELADNFLNHLDLILTEGFKSRDKPKIEVFRSEISESPLCDLNDNLIALVTDRKLKLAVPHFRPDQVSELASFIIKTFVA